MKHLLKFTFVVAAVLMLASCYKCPPEGDHVVAYTVDKGPEQRVYLVDNNEWQALLDRFCDYAEEGSEVTFYNASRVQNSQFKIHNSAKDATTFSTTDREAMKRWMARMEDDGMTVTVTYDPATGIWNGTAYATAPHIEASPQFSVSSSRQVSFATGNLQYCAVTGEYRMAASQYTTLCGTDDTIWTDRFEQDTVRHMGNEWRLLSNAEARYMMEVRLCSAVGGVENARYARAKVVDVHGLLLFPDLFVWPDSVALPVGVNNNGISNTLGWDDNVYSLADWQRLEAAGVVFLPAANSYLYNMVEHADGRACYWTSTTGYAIVAAPDYVGTQDMGDFEQYPIRYVRDNL